MTKRALLVGFMLSASLPLFAQQNGVVVGSPTFGPAKFSNGLTATNDSNYVSLPAGDLTMGASSSWTMEAWLKTTSSSIAVAVSMGTGFSSNSWMGTNGSGHFAASVYGAGGFSNGFILDSGIAINDGNWHHCVMQMTGGTTLATYVDGAVGASAIGSIAPITTSGAIGRFSVLSGYSWAGSIDEVAFWSAAKYGGSFTPPTAPYVGTESNLQAVYHLQADGSSGGTSGGQGSGGSVGIVGSPTFGPAKFSNGLIATNDSNYVSIPAGKLTVSTSSSWTAEAWLKTTSSSLGLAVSLGTGTTSNAWMGVNTNGHFAASVYGSGAFSNAILDSGIVINDGNWHHCVMQMSGGTTLGTYVDGVVGASSSGVIAPITTAGAIGRFSVLPGYSWAGSVDEVAFWSVAKYSGHFTPPTVPYVGTEANLVLLYHLQADGSNSGPSGVQGSPTVIAANSAAILYSPYNWVVTGSSATTINSGAYFRTIFSGTSAALLSNTANNQAPYSELWARVDGDSWQEFTLSSGNPMLTVASGLQSRNHLLEVIVKSTSEAVPRWATNSGTMVTITGIQLDLGATAEAPASRSKHILIYGDSITEGVRTVNATAANDTDRNDVLSDYAYALATAVDAEVGIVGFGGTGATIAGSGGVPALPSSYNFVYSGARRTFSPAPDLVIYNEGTNDSGSITSGLETVINGIIASAPSSKHLILVPFNQTHISDIQSAVTAIGSANVSYLTTSGWFNPADSSDGLHPYGYSQLGFIAPRLFPTVETLLYH